MVNRLNTYITKYNLDEKRLEKTNYREVEKEISYELVHDVKSEYLRLVKKRTTRTVKANIFWMLYEGNLKKMESMREKTTSPIAWEVIVSYYGINLLDFYRQEGLSTEDGNDKPSVDNGVNSRQRNNGNGHSIHR